MIVRDLVIDSIKARGVATNPEIYADVSKEQPCKPVVVRQCVARLVKASIAEKVARGSYRLVAGYEMRCLPVSEFFERRIEQALRSLGGIARTADIHEAVWHRPKGITSRPYEHRLVSKVLRSRPSFRQDFGRGIWNLSREDRLGLPLPGRWAKYELAEGSSQLDERLFFEDVGYAFSIARGDRSVARVARDPVIFKALQDMLRDPHCRSVALEHYRADNQSSGSEAVTVENLSDRESRLPIWAYLLFERGEPVVHRAASQDFYEGCSLRFGVLASDLSRGLATFSTPTQGVCEKCVT